MCTNVRRACNLSRSGLHGARTSCCTVWDGRLHVPELHLVKELNSRRRPLLDHLPLYSLGWSVAVASPQEPYGGIVDGLRYLRGRLITRRSRALASPVTSAATDFSFLAAPCTLRVRAVRSAVQRSPSPLPWLEGPCFPCTCRSRSVGRARGGARGRALAVPRRRFPFGGRHVGRWSPRAGCRLARHRRA